MVANGAIFFRSGAEQSGYPGHRHEQPLFFLDNHARVAMTNCAAVHLAGQFFHSNDRGVPYAEFTMARCLIQRCTTGGEFNGCSLKFLEVLKRVLPTGFDLRAFTRIRLTLANPVNCELTGLKAVDFVGSVPPCEISLAVATNLLQSCCLLDFVPVPISSLMATNELLSLAFTIESGARFFRVADIGPIPSGMVLIPGGFYEMGDRFGDLEQELPVHAVFVSAFLMDQYEVTKALWDEVYSRAVEHGYDFDNRGSGKQPDHPVHSISWYDFAKWCNARSEKEGRMPAYYTGVSKTRVYRTGRHNL